MTVFVVPSITDDEEAVWPSLGPELVTWIEANLVYGPGDLKGEPYRVAPDFAAWLYRAYEVYPHGHANAGRRRFKRVALSERKGLAKTEKAAIIAACELHREAPVRCSGFRRQGRRWVPVGWGIQSDPYIPMVAYTEEQTEELAYGALKVILEESEVAEDFDIGLERIIRLDDRGRADGKAVALAGSPSARDGARTTFQHFDETHRLALPSLVKAHQTMLQNIPKRPMADPWSLETTTAYAPGEGSVAEGTHEYAELVERGKAHDPQLFFFHRQADDTLKIDTPAQRRKAAADASGPAAEWSDLDSIVSQSYDPQTDLAYWERVWLNRIRQDHAAAFDARRWDRLADPTAVRRGTLITLGFDGARRRDATALIGTVVRTGYQFVLGIWETDPLVEDYVIDEADVDAAVADAFARFKVWRMYADPPYWDEPIARWKGRYGDKVVIDWWTNRNKLMAYALREYAEAQKAGAVTHDGNPVFAEHIGNARRQNLRIFDDQNKPLWVIRKERADSVKKIDATMAGCLSWKARLDALAAGALKPERSKAMRTR